MTTHGNYPTPRRAAALVAISVGLALVLVMVTSTVPTRVEATGFVAMRSPGGLAFVAGHRGDSVGAPENTIPAFQRALESDIAYLEADLQLTSDGVPVLMHDWTLDRTTDGTGPVWDITWAELRTLDAGSWHSPEFAGVQVPSLAELLDLLEGSEKGLLLELKGSWTAEQLVPVARDLELRGLGARVVVASFDIRSLSAMREVAPGVQRVIVSREVVGNPATLAATCGAVAIVTSGRFADENPETVSRIREAGLGVLVYTLNSEQSWASAVALGVDGIITDKPSQLDTWLAAAVANEADVG